MFIIFLDFSQAFDRVNKTKLLLKLNGLINTHIWLALVNYVKSASIVVKNKDEVSGKIKTDTGVKQGGPMSPKLFALYIDELIKQLAQSGLLCNTGETTTGIVCYADDVVLACNSRENAQKALTIVETFCKSNQIKINVDKTKWMLFGPKQTQLKKNNDVLEIDGKYLERVNKFKY